MSSIFYNDFGESYLVEEIIIDGFEIFQLTFDKVEKKEKKEKLSPFASIFSPSKLSPLAPEYIPCCAGNVDENSTECAGNVDEEKEEIIVDQPIRRRKTFKDIVDDNNKKKQRNKDKNKYYCADLTKEKEKEREQIILVDKVESSEFTTVTKVSLLNLSTIKPARGGIIISTIIEGMKWFCFGQDWKTGEITDFGGGICYGQDLKTGLVVGRKRRNYRRDGDSHRDKEIIDKDIVQGCLREFKEESLDVFPEITKQILDDSEALFTEKMMIIIIPLSVNPIEISKTFEEQVSKLERHEVRKLFWIPEFLLKQKLSFNTMKISSPFKLYSKVSTLLKKSLMFIDKSQVTK
jgi:hypothetical protein